jgi:hypothetical protein
MAALFPMMSADELIDLAEDIKTNGQLHPIIPDAGRCLMGVIVRPRASWPVSSPGS